MQVTFNYMIFKQKNNTTKKYNAYLRRELMLDRYFVTIIKKQLSNTRANCDVFLTHINTSP